MLSGQKKVVELEKLMDGFPISADELAGVASS